MSTAYVTVVKRSHRYEAAAAAFPGEPPKRGISSVALQDIVLCCF